MSETHKSFEVALDTGAVQMTGRRRKKRKDDFFVSYGHADVVRVAPLVNFLKRTCGLSVWFDGVDGNASVRSSRLLGDAIGNARGALFCVSPAWKRSTWCEGEEIAAHANNVTLKHQVGAIWSVN